MAVSYTHLETFKQPEEKKENSISQVAASEHERL